MAMCVAGLAFGRVTEEAGDIGIAFDVGLAREIKITSVGLRFAGEGVLQVFVSFASCQRRHLNFLHGKKSLGTPRFQRARPQPCVRMIKVKHAGSDAYPGAIRRFHHIVLERRER